MTHLLAQGLEVAVARLPEGEDPDDVRRREGPDALAARIAEAPGYLPWLLEELAPAEARISAESKKDRIRAILEILSAIPDRILRYEEYRRVSREVGVPVEVLWSANPANRGEGTARQAVSGPGGGAPAAAAVQPGGPGTLGNGSVLLGGEIPAAERRLLQLLLRGGEHISLIQGELRTEHLTHPGVRGLSRRSRRPGADRGRLIFTGIWRNLGNPARFLWFPDWRSRKVRSRPAKRSSGYSGGSKKNF